MLVQCCHRGISPQAQKNKYALLRGVQVVRRAAEKGLPSGRKPEKRALVAETRVDVMAHTARLKCALTLFVECSEFSRTHP
jgi:hypothetical protein